MALKNDILSLMESEHGEVLSGSMLAERFGVSRNAVWKAVNALKEEGHSVETVGRKGYRLTDGSDILSEEGIRSFLPEKLRSSRLAVAKEVGSTNDEAKKLSMDYPSEPAVFVADSQLSGRGRFGRKFYSPAKTGLYLSIVFYPHEQLNRAVVYTAMAAVAAARAAEKVCGIRPQIKWINDLYIGERKVAGILTEAETDFETGEVRRMIVGIGVNITTEDFPDSIREKAASLGVKVRRNQLAAEMISEFFSIAEEKPDGFMDEYRSGCFLIGREILFYDGSREYRGTVVSIGDACELVLDTPDGRQTFSHGEILRF